MKGTATIIAETTEDNRIDTLEALGSIVFGILAGWGCYQQRKLLVGKNKILIMIEPS